MIRFGIVGIAHRHIYHLVQGLLDAGAECAGYAPTRCDLAILDGVRQRFPALQPVRNEQELLEDPTVQLVVTAAVPVERAQIAIEAMRHGKDVLTDKPGVVDFAQLAAVEQAVRDTGRLFAICFSERHIVPAVGRALQLVRDGALGEVVHTLGMGPHRLNIATRPAWFFDKSTYGGILVDIASHQIDQFLVLTGSTDAEVTHAAWAHVGHATPPGFQDLGEVALASRTNAARGYVRVDWFTPDGLATWGDGRLFITGTEGTIELRKYVDIAGRNGTDHLFLVDRHGTHHIDCSRAPVTFFHELLQDVEARTNQALPHAHVFTVCRLALEADAKATSAQVRP